jgi:hypothetical protein
LALVGSPTCEEDGHPRPCSDDMQRVASAALLPPGRESTTCAAATSPVAASSRSPRCPRPVGQIPNRELDSPRRNSAPALNRQPAACRFILPRAVFFAFVRWAANDYGTILSRIDIMRAVGPGEAFSTVPQVHLGGKRLLHPAGGRSRRCSRRSTPSRRSASIRLRPRKITGVTRPQPPVGRRAHPQQASSR